MVTCISWSQLKPMINWMECLKAAKNSFKWLWQIKMSPLERINADHNTHSIITMTKSLRKPVFKTWNELGSEVFFSPFVDDEEGGKVHLRDFLLSKQITDGQKGCSNTLSNEEETPFYNPNTVQNENDTWGFLLCISELLHLSSESIPLALYSIEIVNHSSSEKKWLSLHTKEDTTFSYLHLKRDTLLSLYS